MGTTLLLVYAKRVNVTDQSQLTKTLSSQEAAYMAANLAESKKSLGTVVLDVKAVTPLADYFVIAGGSAQSQVIAIAEVIERTFAKFGRKLTSLEGKREGRWVLLDYGDVIIHVLCETERNYYKLEQFWNHALVVDREIWSNGNDDNQIQF